MTRSYDRDAKHYDRTVLTHLVETGQATFFAAANVYVVKTEEGTVAVRPHQIVEITTSLVSQPVEDRVASPMDGYHGQEQYDGEDTGPGGVVYDGLLELAEEFLAVLGDTGTDPLSVVRRMLDDYEGECEQAVREQVADARRGAARPARRGFLTEAQEDNLLSKFL